MMLSCYSQHPTSISYGGHRFNRVMGQVKHHLPQLTPMAHDKRQLGCQLGANRNAMDIQLSTQSAQYSKNHLVHFNWLSSLVGTPEQGSNVGEYFADAKTVNDDCIQSRPRLVNIDWRMLKKLQCRTAVHHDGR